MTGGLNTALFSHYGYFIEAAAAVAKYDPDWAAPENWGGMVEMVMRDISAWDPDDPLFGPFRYFEPYEGHGWADGMGFDRGNNQESSSESMNFNSAMILWGIHTGNTAIRDMGLFMYTHEARAIEQYWWDVDGVLFPDYYGHTAVGMVWGTGGHWGTWFSGDPGHIIGINILPVTPGHLYFGRRPDFIPRNFEEGNSGSWSEVLWEYLAFADGDRAMQLSSGGMEKGDAGGSGGSPAYHYHHINSVAAAGQLSTAVTADVPSYAVFDKGKVRTYTAYNPDFETCTVTFNDGYAMEVPPRAQVTRQGPVQDIVAAVVPDPHFGDSKWIRFLPAPSLFSVSGGEGYRAWNVNGSRLAIRSGPGMVSAAGRGRKVYIVQPGGTGSDRR